MNYSRSWTLLAVVPRYWRAGSQQEMAWDSAVYLREKYHNAGATIRNGEIKVYPRVHPEAKIRV
jgi:hypothetical protein